jgi:glycosyltransferase involved in cell wall biosynthesis
MKIIYITPYPPSEDGIAQYAAKIVDSVKSIGKKHTDIAVYSFKRHGVAEPNQYALMSPNPFSWLKIYHGVRQKKPDIIHLQFDISNFMFAIAPLYFLMLLLKHRSSAKIAATYHEAYRDKQLYGIFSVIFYRVFSRLFDRIYVHSEVSKQCLIDIYHLPSEKIGCIALGTQKFTSKKKNHAELRKRYKLDSKKVVLSFGYIYRTKGLEYLVDAIALLKKQGHELPAVIIAGQVPKRNGFLRIFQYRNEAYLKRIKQQIDSYKLNSVFHFTGYVASEELFSLFTLADVVVLPYVSIDQSAVLNTAISAHTPVIASDIGGMSETLRSCGVLVKPRDAEAISTKLSKLLSDKVFCQQLVAEYKVLSEGLSTANVARQLFEDYRSLSEKKLYIFQITPYYPPQIGGMQLRIRDLSERLAREPNLEVTVITSDQGTKPHVEIVNQNLRVEYLRSIELLQTPIIWSLPFKLWKIPKTSIVHVHVAQAFVPDLTAIICKLRGIPFIVHMRLDVPHSTLFGKIFLGTYKNIFLKHTLRSANHMIVLTRDYVDIMSDKYGIDRQIISVIPNGTDFRKAEHPKVLPEHTIKLLFVGRLSSQKNIPLLIDSINSFRESYARQIHLDIVGDGKLKGALEKKVKQLKLSKLIKFRNALSGEELESIYEESDIFVLTSSHEAFGTVLIESMAKGLPIVATKIDAVKNVVKDSRNGLLTLAVPGEIAESINKLVTDGRFYTQISKNNLHDISRYDWATVIKKTIKIYEAIT